MTFAHGGTIGVALTPRPHFRLPFDNEEAITSTAVTVGDEGARAGTKLGIEDTQDRQHDRLLKEVVDEFLKLLQMIAFKPTNVRVIPSSVFRDDNLITNCDKKAQWYKGWETNINRTNSITGFTILDDAPIDFIELPQRHHELPVPACLHKSNMKKKIGPIISGNDELGTVAIGDIVGIVPSGLLDKKNSSIEQHNKQPEKGFPGDSVGLSIKKINKDETAQSGDIICVQKEGDLEPIKAFTTMVAAQENHVIFKQSSANMQHKNGAIFFASYYIIFGVLHELSHVAMASFLLPSSPSYQAATIRDLISFLIRASLGRFCLIDVGDAEVAESSSLARHIAAIRHFGWIFSLGIAICVHYWHRRCEYCSPKRKCVSWLTSVFEQPIFVIAAYVAALEGICTDLLGLVPVLNQVSLQSNVYRLWA
jgi:hypothetical protein